MEVIRTLNIKSPNLVGHDINVYTADCHNHTFYEFMVVKSGNAMHYVNDTVEKIGKREIVFIRPDDAHYFKSYTDLQYEFYNIHVSIRDMEKEFVASPELKRVILDTDVPPRVSVAPMEFEMLIHRIEALNAEKFGTKRDYLYYTILKEVCWQMISNSVIKNPVMTHVFEQFLIDISKPEVFTMEFHEIIKNSTFTQGYLCKCFKKYVGVTPTEYINDLRLAYAYDLIHNKKVTALDACVNSGFNNYSYFYRLFKKKYNVAPSDIKKV